MPTIKIKLVDFKSIAALHPEGYDFVKGFLDYDKREIKLDRRLENYCLPSIKDTVYHELGHYILFDCGADKDLDEVQTEAFCDLWAIWKYPSKNLYGLELIHKRNMGVYPIGYILKTIGAPASLARKIKADIKIRLEWPKPMSRGGK